MDDPSPRSFGSMLGAMKVVSLSPDYGLGVLGNVVLVAWRGNTSVSAVESVTKTVRRVAEETHVQVGLLQYVAETAEAPGDARVRGAIVQMLRSCGPHLASSAVVAPGTGFRISAGRAIVTGITMLVRPRFPHVIFSTLEEAVTWQAELLPRPYKSRISASRIAADTRLLLMKSQDAARQRSGRARAF